MSDIGHGTPLTNQNGRHYKYVADNVIQMEDGHTWFAEEKDGHELYHVKVGDGVIVVAVGNFERVPVKKAERREHISRVISDNVKRFFLSNYSVETFCHALNSRNCEMDTRKCAAWIKSQHGKPAREVMLEARRRFAGTVEELLFSQFDKAISRQLLLSQQEWEVARRLANGMAEKEIAEKVRSVATNNHLRSRRSQGNSDALGVNSGFGSESDQGLSPETVRKVVRALRQKARGSVNRLAAVYWFLGFEL